jgi:NADP-dependent 3-hydroxy acid dehydrogenase YdfG
VSTSVGSLCAAIASPTDPPTHPGGTVYSATKFAVRVVTEGLRMEHRADNIRCTMISPGAVATELPKSSSEEGTRKNLREFYKNGYSG